MDVDDCENHLVKVMNASIAYEEGKTDSYISLMH